MTKYPSLGILQNRHLSGDIDFPPRSDEDDINFRINSSHSSLGHWL